MLDPRLLRSDPAAVAANLARRGFQLDLERLRALEERRKAAQVAADELRAARNAHAKSVGKAKAQGQDIAALVAEGEALGNRLTGLDQELAAVQAEFDELVLGLPNLLHDSVPDGRDETANVEVRRWGTPRTFDFEPLDHVAIGEKLALMDFEAAGRISGARFVVLKGGVARLHRALIQYMLDLHTGEHGYTEIYAPYLVRAACAGRHGAVAQVRGGPVPRRLGRTGALPDPDRGSAGHEPRARLDPGGRPRCRAAMPRTRRASAPRPAPTARTRAA